MLQMLQMKQNVTYVFQNKIIRNFHIVLDSYFTKKVSIRIKRKRIELDKKELKNISLKQIFKIFVKT